MQEREVNIIKLWDSIWDNRKFIIIFCLVVGIITAGISLILPKWYKAKASIFPPTANSGALGALSSNLNSFGLGGIMGGASDGTNRLLAIAKSWRMRQMVNDRFDFTTRYKAEFDDDAIKQLGKKLIVSTGREDEITITFYDKDQEIVAEVVKFIVTKLDSLEIQFSQNQALENRDFIASRTQEVRDSLEAVQEDFLDFMNEHDIISIPDQVSAAIDQAAKMKAEIAAQEIDLKISSKMYQPDNLIISQKKEKLSMTRDNYKEMFYSNDSQLFLDLKQVPKYQLEYLVMEREIEYLSTLLEFLGPQYESAKIEAANNVSRIQVLDHPKRPDRRYKPRRAFLVVLATFVAFCLSLFIIYIRSAIKETRREEQNR